jgi:hypothetical protein
MRPQKSYLGKRGVFKAAKSQTQQIRTNRKRYALILQQVWLHPNNKYFVNMQIREFLLPKSPDGA